MDKTIFTKTKKSWDSGEFTDYVLTDKAPNYYFEITPSSESKAAYPETWGDLHSHQFYMIIWPFAGKGRHIVDSQEYEMQGGRLFFLNPNQLHTIRDYSDVRGVVFTFSDDFFSLIEPKLAEHIKYEVFSRKGRCMYCDINDTIQPKLEDMLENMKEEMNHKEIFGHNYAMAAYFTSFMLELERFGKWSQDVIRKIDSKSYQTYLDFIALIEQEYSKKRDVYWYARRLDISVSLLSRYVKMYDSSPTHQMTPLKYINNRIMIEAERQLMHSSKTVSEISDMLGFDNSSNFTKFFKKMDEQKRTPTQYREQWTARNNLISKEI